MDPVIKEVTEMQLMTKLYTCMPEVMCVFNIRSRAKVQSEGYVLVHMKRRSNLNFNQYNGPVHI
jgi:hypothetical protein